ncbi:MAG TPA: 16S rRNA (adenine(1518)-N(6)/adenine(1519)-N(6))-dimethyltransferase RsmA, partial [Thermodesulfobacteriota bacterium]|nr:16S rRNA (adenine(1518)-N(6)/adenine(1519)-N(6))-dimethyltransferase RsmA [Thermodesulfobacteriota bacterium]
IGAGLGGLTCRLAEQAKKVFAIEKDAKLATLLRTKIIRKSNVEIIHQDALHFDYQRAANETGQTLTVVGNLPFYISSLLTIELLKKREHISRMVLMYQKEVAERITAQPGNKNYGFLTLMTNLYADSVMVLSVGKEAFYPRPKVESQVIKFNLLPFPREPLEEEKFFTVFVKALFSQRRKTLKNAIKAVRTFPSEFIERIFTEARIDPHKRPEELTLKEFVFLSNRLSLQLKMMNT